MKTRHLRVEDLRGKRARGLIRESTERQAEQWSPDRQRADLTRAAEELGLVSMDQWYVRVGSGEAEGVPELEAALADAQRGEYDVLLVAHTSRFARNRAEAVRMKLAFRKAGTVIYFAAQRLISGTFAGGLAEGINEVIDEHANEERRYWIAGGLRERQLAGLWVGRIPYGYRKLMVDREDGSRTWGGTLEVDPEAGPVVRRMFEWSVLGMSGLEIARRLNSENVPGAGGNGWSARTITALLENPVYAGRHLRYRYSTARHYYDEDDAHDGRQELSTLPEIVPVGLWEDSRLMIAGRATGNHGSPRDYPLSRLIRCGQCGHHYGGASSGATRYYRCPTRASGKDCLGATVKADAVEAVFAAWLATFRLPTDWREAIAKTDARVDNNVARRAKLKRRLAALNLEHQWGGIEDEEYRRELTAVKAEMAAIVKPDTAGLAAGVAMALERLGDSWADQSAPSAVRSALPKLLLTAITVHDRQNVELVVRPELRPLLDLCAVPRSGRPYHSAPRYTVAFA